MIPWCGLGVLMPIVDPWFRSLDRAILGAQRKALGLHQSLEYSQQIQPTIPKWPFIYILFAGAL